MPLLIFKEIIPDDRISCLDPQEGVQLTTGQLDHRQPSIIFQQRNRRQQRLNP